MRVLVLASCLSMFLFADFIGLTPTQLQNKIDKNQPFILVCRSGNRTSQVGRYLANTVKYKNVFHLEHGIKSWIKEKRKVNK